jgi:stage V sporulation protein SpoVS
MSTPSGGGGILSGLGSTIVQAITGTDVNQIQAQVQQAETYLEAYAATLVVLEAIIALELLVIMVGQWKERH